MEDDLADIQPPGNNRKLSLAAVMCQAKRRHYIIKTTTEKEIKNGIRTRQNN